MTAPDERQQRIMSMLDLAPKLAAHIWQRYGGDYDDILSDAYYATVCAVDSWQPEGGRSLRTWVYQKIMFGAIDGYRKRTEGGRSEHTFHSLDEAWTDEDGIPAEQSRRLGVDDANLQAVDDRLHNEWLRRELERLLATVLSPGRAAVMRRHYLDGVPLNDIARERGAAIGGTWQLASKARAQLRERVADVCPELAAEWRAA